MSRNNRNFGAGVRQALQFGKQQPQVGRELRSGQLAVDHAPGGERKDEHQQPAERQHGEPMSALLGVAGVRNPPQAGEQGGQLAPQGAYLSADGRLAGLLLRRDGSCRLPSETGPADSIVGATSP